MTRNSIVLVPFPFDDFSDTKLRPALCLTNEIGTFQHVIIAFISSNISKEILDSDIIIRKESKDWVDTGLAVDSLIRIHKLITIPKYLFKRKLGRINKNIENIVAVKVKHLFEIQ
nr:type II toxin-antitoxin system PemK/MazF family toxin [Bacteroidota bacterium]